MDPEQGEQILKTTKRLADLGFIVTDSNADSSRKKIKKDLGRNKTL
jgi:hypothetical protein